MVVRVPRPGALEERYQIEASTGSQTFLKNPDRLMIAISGGVATPGIRVSESPVTVLPTSRIDPNPSISSSKISVNYLPSLVPPWLDAFLQNMERPGASAVIGPGTQFGRIRGAVDRAYRLGRRGNR